LYNKINVDPTTTLRPPSFIIKRSNRQ